MRAVMFAFGPSRNFAASAVWDQALSDYPPVQCRCHSRARASLRTRHQGPSIMGFEDEAEQSIGRPCRQTDGRDKRPATFNTFLDDEFDSILLSASMLSGVSRSNDRGNSRENLKDFLRCARTNLVDSRQESLNQSLDLL